MSKGNEYSIDEDTEINVLAPPNTDETVNVTRPATGAKVKFKPINSNENGAVYKLDGERSALFMGDLQDKAHHHGESWLMEQYDDPKSDIDLDTDVLFVAHHGSGKATSMEFLERDTPSIAVISSDFAEEHGHPTDEVLKNLHEHDADVYWTAAHGTIRTDLDDGLTVEHTNDDRDNKRRRSRRTQTLL